VIDRDDRGSRRVLRIAIAVSLGVHLLGFLLYGLATAQLAHVKFAFARPTPTPDTVVTISNAITIEKRAKPQPEPRPLRGANPAMRPSAQSPQRVASIPRPVVEPRPPEPQPVPPQRALHQLAKVAPTAPANPPKTIEATAPPKPEQTPMHATQPHQVALAQRPAQASRPSQLSQARIAQMTQNFDKTLAELRRESAPLNVKPENPSATKRYHVQMIGVDGDLRHGQGYYYPIKSWREDGYDYYYVSYDFTWADGTFESGGVPWPIRFRPRDDPFTHPDDPNSAKVPLAAPMAGWRLPSGEKVGKALESLYGQQDRPGGDHG
jgi:hypothetical protein